MKKLFAFLAILLFPVAACDYDGSITGLKFPIDQQIHCTTFSINEARGLWLTAYHCVDDRQTYLVNGEEATVFLYDDIEDVAVLYAPKAHAQAIPFCNEAPEKGDKVYVIGHTYGWDQKTYLTGIVANPYQGFKMFGPNGDMIKGFTIFAIDGVAPGNSGSPVIKGNCGVVSVVQRGGDGLTLGITWDKLKTFTEGSWDRSTPAETEPVEPVWPED